ncbi:MAG: prolipoprotein diacylglyceryl transferase [Lachnospiraceae bacterium]|nr:prolipoprotein diacylglyceryl transferase [Lachnospiraceae bacterium]
MFPTVSVFGHDIGSYSICAVIGMIVAAIYVYFAVRGRDDLDSVQLVNVAAVSGLGVFLGAHILFGVTKWRELVAALSDPAGTFASVKDFITTFVGIFGGMVFYGGLIGGVVAGFWYIARLRHIRLDPFVYADVYAPAIPLFHVFGRIGCFLGGCCYGIEGRWGFVYHNAPVAESNGVMRIPVQLIESAGNLLLFVILHKMSRKAHSRGTIFASYFVMYSVMRFVLEFFRGDVLRGFAFGLSTSQWISIIMFIVGCICIGIFTKRQKEEI